MFREHFMKLKTQIALEQAERKKRKLDANPSSYGSLAPATTNTATSRPKSFDQSSDSEHDSEACRDSTNGAMQEIYHSLKHKRLEKQSLPSADCLNAKDRVELLKFLLLDVNMSVAQKADIMKQLCSIAGI